MPFFSAKKWFSLRFVAKSILLKLTICSPSLCKIAAHQREIGKNSLLAHYVSFSNHEGYTLLLKGLYHSMNLYTCFIYIYN